MDPDILTAAASQLHSACLQGLTFYRMLAYQAQQRFGAVAAATPQAMTTDVQAQADAELAALVTGLPSLEGGDCAALVQMCLLKMGDLARCAPCLRIEEPLVSTLTVCYSPLCAITHIDRRPGTLRKIASTRQRKTSARHGTLPSTSTCKPELSTLAPARCITNLPLLRRRETLARPVSAWRHV